tara:strand:+ start:181 stop:534 length:354 start_codon:yes stop_codon:yes gene_type:complete
MKTLYENAVGETPQATSEWKKMPQKERMSLLGSAFNAFDVRFKNNLDLIFANDNGEVTFRFKSEPAVADRGEILMSLECVLKEKVFDFIYVSIEPLGDKNSLRRLRGIDIVKGVNEI